MQLEIAQKQAALKSEEYQRVQQEGEAVECRALIMDDIHKKLHSAAVTTGTLL